MHMDGLLRRICSFGRNSSRSRACALRNPPIPPGTTEAFHADVVACMERLAGPLIKLMRRYEATALAGALAMHLVSCLSLCVRSGKMTREQAAHFVAKIGALEFDERLLRPANSGIPSPADCETRPSASDASGSTETVIHAFPSE
jgi:hypothetical protein